MTDTIVTNNAGGADRSASLDMSGSDNLYVATGALFSVSANQQSVRFNDVTSAYPNDPHIINDGTIENTASGGRAIQVETSVGSSFEATIDNHASGVIQSDGDAFQIQAGSVTSGRVALTNAGVIRSTGADGGQALDFEGATGSFLIHNSGTIGAATSDAIRIGDSARIENSGVITGGDRGIVINDSTVWDGPLADLHRTTIINDGGTIEGSGGVGIQIVSAFDDTITNSGTITGGDGHAIIFGSGDNKLILQDGSIIEGTSDGGAGVDWLDYSSYSGSVTVDMAAGVATATGGVLNFENVMGSAGDDLIRGNDLSNALNGVRGHDTLEGGAGDDRYYVNSFKDVIVENAGEGRDSVFTSRDFTLSDNVENIYSWGATKGIALAGNELDNELHGSSGSFGSSSNDTLTGFDGDDNYFADAGDTIVEAANGGTDSVYARTAVLLSNSFTLSENVENLYAYRAGADESFSLTGNALDNIVKGGSGDDVIDGGEGRDRLYGDAGGDTFVFTSVSGSNPTYYDRIYDFVSGDDKVDLSAINPADAASLHWIGDGAYTHTAGEVRERFSGTATTLVEADLDGDGRSDFRIAFAEHPDLSSNDFLF